MTRLEDIKNGALVGGIVPGQAVEAVTVEWIGKQAINLVYRASEGVAETTCYREDETRLSIEQSGRVWSFDADGSHLRLVTEANRINLAHHFDPYLAIHTSLVDPLPHQITAVYGEMLSRQPLRFLLADDPGAGKTIMAGLLIKELITRGEIERCLVVVPGSLVEQWQDELGGKFSLEFDILTSDMIASSRSGNVFNDHNFLIARLDVLARNEDLQQKLMAATEWDLVVCDEAHRMSASYYGGEVKYTKRYQLGQMLGQMCRHLLMMTATPHNGKEEDFQLFLALLDGDRFEGRFRDGVEYTDSADLMRRLTKEELRKFDGRPLFPERRAYTARYELSPEEADLYTDVTEYVRTEMNRVQRFAPHDGKKKNNVGFALQILQRRLASSPAAIHMSLQRRRERLERELSEARLAQGREEVDEIEMDLPDQDDFLLNMEEYDQEEVDRIEDLISARATTAETVPQLEKEIQTLRRLEQKAFEVLLSDKDAKWRELDRILDDELMKDSDGNRRKLIIFTEARDTLDYLYGKVGSRLGCHDAVAFIHGGVKREERAKVVERFMQDRDLLVLIANDAAGEGVNLQRGHLMVNYDLPWNPNKIEQRFGRVHRIGQTEVCHLWNLVAAETREGEVYARLLEKLEVARNALGGRVYDVLGELFEGTSLRHLLLEAIQYGEQDEVKARLFEAVDGAVDQENLLHLLESRSLTNEVMPEDRVQNLRLEMEQAEAQRLQPHHIQSFFVEALRHLGGKVIQCDDGRWEITRVPRVILDRDRQIGTGVPLQKRYERICFKKGRINQQPVATYVCPGHPLLEATVSVILERYDHLMKIGAVMVDDTDMGHEIAALFLLEHSVQDGRCVSSGGSHVISETLQFASVDQYGRVVDAGPAPHLNLRAAAQEEIDRVNDLLDADWLRTNLEKSAKRFATEELAQRHVSKVRARRLPEIDKIKQEVESRLRREINYWDARAEELKEEERAGRKTRTNWQKAAYRAEELAERMQRRLDVLGMEKFISAQPPRVRGGMVVIPKGLLDTRAAAGEIPADPPMLNSQDPAARLEIEIAAMNAVMEKERSLGNEPVDVSSEKRGYDIVSFDPVADHNRFIEVKGRVNGANTVMITRNEIMTSLNEPEKYILAIVRVEDGVPGKPSYVRGPLDTRGDPPFEQSAVQFKIDRLLEREEGQQ